jgi:hypothetical protein
MKTNFYQGIKKENEVALSAALLLLAHLLRRDMKHAERFLRDVLLSYRIFTKSNGRETSCESSSLK